MQQKLDAQKAANAQAQQSNEQLASFIVVVLVEGRGSETNDE